MTVRAPLIRLFEDEAFIDGFAGGGGASTGVEMALGCSPDVAINHDAEALAMHTANHPKTRHLRTNIKRVNFKRAMRGKPVGGAWFSPDCTYHSKARGGKPFRDRNRARRIRGLAWEMVRCAIQVRPRVLFMENVEEIEFWGPLDKRGVPIPEKRGTSWLRFVARLRNLGYVCEWRRLRAKGHGAPTTRTRLFFIARCDGQPIVWPKETHGPGLKPYHTAAECIDFGQPVPSIFLTKTQAKAWGKAHGVAAPKRPLALATQRRIARGVVRFVLETPEPFIVSNLTNNVARPVSEPLSTLLTGNHKYLVTPFLAAVRHQDDSHLHSVGEPLRTISASDREIALVSPSLIRVAHGERDASGKKRGKGEHAVTEPLPTQTASNEFALVTAFLAGVGGRKGQSPETPVDQPYHTITAKADTVLVAPVLMKYHGQQRTGEERVHAVTDPIATLDTSNRFGLVAAFLAKHNGGHEATGQTLTRPMDAIVCRENKALVTSHLVKLRGGLSDHVLTAQDVREPAPTLTAGGTHIAEVRAFLVKFYGTKKDGRPLQAPLDTVTTKERFGLVTVMIAGEQYVIVDIGMRMLTPRELFLCQGFPITYQIDCTVKLPGQPRKRLTKKAQTRLVGNSVPPQLAAALIGANYVQARRHQLLPLEVA